MEPERANTSPVESASAPARVLLTGASGTLGSHILHQLVARDDVALMTIGRQPHETVESVQHEVVDFDDEAALISRGAVNAAVSADSCAPGSGERPIRISVG